VSNPGLGGRTSSLIRLSSRRKTQADVRSAPNQAVAIGKTRVWREGVTDGDPGAIRNTEGECWAMLLMARWNYADDVYMANRARNARGLEAIGLWAKYECRPYR
jgi:hypothetical protein